MVRWGKLEVEPKRPALSSIYNNKKSVPFLYNKSKLSKMGQKNQYISQWQHTHTHTHTNLGIKKKKPQNSLGSGSLDFWWKMSPARKKVTGGRRWGHWVGHRESAPWGTVGSREHRIGN